MHEHPWPETAEALMRSRFAAVRDANAEWLLASWHPSTRPASLDLTGNPTWRGLQIIDTVAGGPGDDTGIEGVALYHWSPARRQIPDPTVNNRSVIQ